MKQSLQLKLGQQLTMTPQLQQAIKLLQLSTLDLQQEIQEALESNPMLEVNEEEIAPTEQPTANQNEQAPGNEVEQKESNSPGEASEADESWQDSIPEDLPVDTSWDDIYQPSSGPSLSNDDIAALEANRTASQTLQNHLEWQLNLTPFSDRDRVIAEAIIDAISDSGVLTSPAQEIFEGLQPHLEELEEDEVLAVLHRIQHFDPVGVAAHDLSECLLIQLNLLDPGTPCLKSAKTIVREHLPLLGGRDYKQIMRRVRIKEYELKEAIKIIQSLNPAPGESISESHTEYVVPDVYVSKNNGRWSVNLNPDIAPRIRINDDYAALVKRADSTPQNTFLKDNLQEARWFLKSLQSRNETLLKVATCIVEKQKDFLDYGAEAMRPLVLHDIAELVDMHESTISRVTTQKYMHTPQGIFELKYFFSSHVSTDSGGECSSTAIRAIIKKLVAAENPLKPLSDSKITDLLAEQGIQVARRTIAKYRESLNIPASNERKRLV